MVTFLYFLFTVLPKKSKAIGRVVPPLLTDRKQCRGRLKRQRPSIQRWSSCQNLNLKLRKVSRH